MEEELLNLLKKNLQYSVETREMVAKIKKYIFWQQIFNVVKVVVIVVPVVLAIIYAIPFLRDAMAVYQELLGAFSGGNLSNRGSADILNQFLK